MECLAYKFMRCCQLRKRDHPETVKPIPFLQNFSLHYFILLFFKFIKLVFHTFVPYIQLFRERLSGKVHATILKGIVGGFEFSFFHRNLKELARKAVDICLRVLRKATKLDSTATVVRNSVLIISDITFLI